ncbi:hypothetical protein LTR37_012072 [Vermiconidia calcicola]|uniref:Uncharacterized protein n=1 Tax=Vermiconidia calcicola TaxID=1690605 RepID=A0ACC3N0D1_9PEZI|nr:hypothetical protein LTR37_012072 [Vermiconidia calcicola]
MRSSDPRERTSELIAKRTMTTNFAAIHTTTLTSTNLLIDLLSSDQKLGFVDALDSEIEAIDKTNGGSWSKSALAEMTRTDSALRESMRVSGFVIFGVQRKVVAKEGVTLPDGTNIPYSNIITVPRGVRITMKPFTSILSTSRKDDEPARNDKDLAKILDGKNMSSVSTGSHFMQFGHGKRSSPGRFFAVQEIKLMMAYMLLNYDIKYIGARPERKWMGTLVVPDTSATILVKRKS